MISSAGLIKYNCSNTESLFGLYTKYVTKCNVCALVTLSNIGVYRRIFESGLAKQYIVFDEMFLSIKNLCKEYKNVEFVEINTKNLIEKIEGKNMKFDLVIGNPPYDGKYYPLYLSILKSIKNNTNKIIWICPTKWTDCLKENDNFIDAIKNMNPIFNHYERLNSEVFENAIFDGDIAIYVFGTKNEDLSELKWDKHKNKKLAKSIFEKFSNFEEHLSDYCHKDFKYKFYVRGTRVRGNFGKWDWTTMFGNDQMNDFSKTNISWSDNYWNYKSKEECRNFIDFCNTDIIMYSLFLVKYGKNNNQGELSNMPWFGDYTKKWTETEIAKKLKLTKEEVEYIHQEMANFGWKAKGNK